ncbi:uncharacterized protein LOC128277040, partial [Anopheles cruzii]|uniref:uncharacterized protein LOC128277040 n=1 Tax=Anopheles cruzii TaxID=68878 RepID=UPI0022EC7397
MQPSTIDHESLHGTIKAEPVSFNSCIEGETFATNSNTGKEHDLSDKDSSVQGKSGSTDNQFVAAGSNMMEQDVAKRIQNELAVMQETISIILKTLLKVEAKVEVISMNHQSVFSPIDTVEQLDEFEKHASNEKFITQFKFKIEQYKPLTQEKGRNVCFQIVDHIFTRELLTKFSWSGNANRENEKKIAFRKYRKTINLFFGCVW